MTQTSHINGLAEQAKPGLTPIEAVRADLAAWSAGKPKAVRNAVANLDGWLETADIAAEWGYSHPTVNILACTARAVETLRAAVTDTQHHQVLKHQ